MNGIKAVKNRDFFHGRTAMGDRQSYVMEMMRRKVCQKLDYMVF